VGVFLFCRRHRRPQPATGHRQGVRSRGGPALGWQAPPIPRSTRYVPGKTGAKLCREGRSM